MDAQLHTKRDKTQHMSKALSALYNLQTKHDASYIVAVLYTGASTNSRHTLQI